MLLGNDQHNSQSSAETDESSSYANSRASHQRLHEEITRQMTKSYFHVLLIGYNLGNYLERYGRLKKYLKLCSDLFELDLAAHNLEDSFKDLETFLA